MAHACPCRAPACLQAHTAPHTNTHGQIAKKYLAINSTAVRSYAPATRGRRDPAGQCAERHRKLARRTTRQPGATGGVAPIKNACTRPTTMLLPQSVILGTEGKSACPSPAPSPTARQWGPRVRACALGPRRRRRQQPTACQQQMCACQEPPVRVCACAGGLPHSHPARPPSLVQPLLSWAPRKKTPPLLLFALLK